MYTSAVKPFNISSSNYNNFDKDSTNQSNTNRPRIVRRINHENNLRNINRIQRVQEDNNLRREKLSNKGVVFDNKKVTSENNQTRLSNSSALTPIPRYFTFESSVRNSNQSLPISIGNNEIRIISTNPVNPLLHTPDSFNDSSSRIQDPLHMREQTSAPSIDNQSKDSSDSYKNKLCIREVASTGISGNQHNSGN